MRIPQKQSLIILTMVLISIGLAGCSTLQKTGGSQAVLDRIEIKEKMGLYSFAWDEGRPEEFRNFFAEDAVFETWAPRKKAMFYKFGSLQEIIEGRKALSAQAPGDMAIRHNLSEVTFLELTEKTAKTKTIYTFSMFMQTNLNEPSLIVSGSFNDTWVKTDKGWLIKNRVIIYDNMPPALADMAK